MLTLVPYVLMQAGGYSGTAAGAALLPFPLILAVASPLMGGLAGRIGPRLPLTIGPIIVAAGFLLTLRISAEGGYWTTVLPAILVIAIGMAAAVAPLTTAVLTSVDAQHTGSASGLNSAVARTGGLIATALLGGERRCAGRRLPGRGGGLRGGQRRGGLKRLAARGAWGEGLKVAVSPAKAGAQLSLSIQDSIRGSETPTGSRPSPGARILIRPSA